MYKSIRDSPALRSLPGISRRVAEIDDPLTKQDFSYLTVTTAAFGKWIDSTTNPGLPSLTEAAPGFQHRTRRSDIYRQEKKSESARNEHPGSSML
jgi:hypothetical protein